MADVKQDLSRFWRLSTAVYGRGPFYVPIRTDRGAIDGALSDLKRAHERLVGAHRDRLRQAQMALQDWQGQHAIDFVLFVNLANLPTPAGVPSSAAKLASGVLVNDIALLIARLRAVRQRADELDFDILIANAAWAAEAGQAIASPVPPGLRVPSWFQSFSDRLQSGEAAMVAGYADRHRSEMQYEYQGHRRGDPPPATALVALTPPGPLMTSIASAVPDRLSDYMARRKGDDMGLVDLGIRLVGTLAQVAHLPAMDSRLGPWPDRFDQGARVRDHGKVHCWIDDWTRHRAEEFVNAARDRGLLPASGGDLGNRLYTFPQTPTEIKGELEADMGGLSKEMEETIETDEADLLSAQVKEAERQGDRGKVRELLAELKDHMGSPTFMARFFRSLGADGTLAATDASRDDPATLKPLDEGLAAATNAPGWDSKFNRELWGDLGAPGVGPNSDEDHRERMPRAEPLLRFGVHSEDFLTVAGDQLLMRYGTGQYGLKDAAGNRHESINENPDNLQHQQWYRSYLLALDRNPVAAEHFLLGAYRNWDGTDNDHSRLQLLLKFDGGQNEQVLLGNVINTVGKLGEPAVIGLLMQTGELENKEVVDGVRPVIASLLERHLEWLAGPTSIATTANDVQEWKRNLFEIAEMNQDGTLDKDRAAAVTGVVSAWAGSVLEDPESWHADGTPKGAAMEHVGAVNGLAFEPLARAAILDGMGTFDSRNGWLVDASWVTIGVGLWPPLAVPAAISAAFEVIYGGLQADDEAKVMIVNGRRMVALESLTKEQIAGEMIALAIAKNPNILPPDLHTQLIAGKPIEPNSPLGQHLRVLRDAVGDNAKSYSLSPLEQNLVDRARGIGEGFSANVENSNPQRSRK